MSMLWHISKMVPKPTQEELKCIYRENKIIQSVRKWFVYVASKHNSRRECDECTFLLLYVCDKPPCPGPAAHCIVLPIRATAATWENKHRIFRTNTHSKLISLSNSNMLAIHLKKMNELQKNLTIFFHCNNLILSAHFTSYLSVTTFTTYKR